MEQGLLTALTPSYTKREVPVFISNNMDQRASKQPIKENRGADIITQ